MECFYRLLNIPVPMTTTIPNPDTVFGAVLILKNVADPHVAWGEEQWRKWLFAKRTAPCEMFDTVAQEWTPPATVHTYGWVINVDTLFLMHNTVKDMDYVYGQLSDAAAKAWRQRAPEPETLVHLLAHGATDKTIAAHYHGSAQVSRLRAAACIDAGTQLQLRLGRARPYAYDPRDYRSVNVDKSGVVMNVLKPGQPLIVAPTAGVAPPPAKKRRTEDRVLVTANHTIEGDDGALKVVRVKSEYRIAVTDPRPGHLWVPFSISDEPTPTLFPHRFDVYPTLPCLVADTVKNKTRWFKVLHADGTRAIRAKNADRWYPDAIAHDKSQGVAVPQSIAAGGTTHNKVPLPVFVGPTPTLVPTDHVVVAVASMRDGVPGLTIPTSRPGIVYSYTAVAGEADATRSRSMPMRLVARHSYYGEMAGGVSHASSNTAWMWATKDYRAPAIVNSHLSFSLPNFTTAIPFKHPTTQDYEDTAMCSELSNQAPKLLQAATAAWGQVRYGRSLRIDVNKAGGIVLPIHRINELKRSVAMGRGKQPRNYVALGYQDGRACAAEAFGIKNGTFTSIVVGQECEPVWPAFICEFET